MSSYGNYSLSQLKEWIYSVIDCDEITADQIYDTFIEVIDESYNYHSEKLMFLSELSALLKNKKEKDLDNRYQEIIKFYSEK